MIVPCAASSYVLVVPIHAAAPGPSNERYGLQYLLYHWRDRRHRGDSQVPRLILRLLFADPSQDAADHEWMFWKFPRRWPTSAKEAGLRYVRDSRSGIVRRRVKRMASFRYFGAAGQPVRDREQLERIRRPAIPPAWQDVWICPNASGHLQATGRDATQARNADLSSIAITPTGAPSGIRTSMTG